MLAIARRGDETLSLPRVVNIHSPTWAWMLPSENSTTYAEPISKCTQTVSLDYLRLQLPAFALLGHKEMWHSTWQQPLVMRGTIIMRPHHWEITFLLL